MALPASSPLGAAAPVLGVVHPLFQRYRETWIKLLDVFEGSGGFIDDTKPYLIAHPREWLDHSSPVYSDDKQVLRYEVNRNPKTPSPKLLERRKLARYENIAATLITTLAGALFKTKPQRSFGPTAVRSNVLRPIEQFWSDADGNGTTWNDLLREAWEPCAAMGHMWGYVDVHPDDPKRILVKWYTPIDVIDWLVDDRNRLRSVKLLEAVPRESYAKTATAYSTDLRVREIDDKGWKLLNRNGRTIDSGTHTFGVVPVFILYAKRKALTPFVGRSVLGDPQLYIDLYNIDSETRELLRKQTFSILNVPIGDAPGGVQREQELIGQQSGTGNILFTTNPAEMLSNDASNVESYHEHKLRLQRTIYRLAILPWEGDGRAAEAADSRRIKREDLTQQLADFADELQRVDQFVTDLAYRAAYGPAFETWKANDALTIGWPEEFDTEPLEALLKRFGDALTLDLGPTAAAEIRKRAARRVLPDLHADMQQLIDQEIDASPTETPAQRRQAALNAMTMPVITTQTENADTTGTTDGNA